MKQLDLVFQNEQGKSVTISLNHPAEPANAVAIKEAMDEIIARNIFTSSGGALIKVKSARISSSDATVIDLNGN
ncbi:MAG: DUF2922 domain-containing protein [Sporolactobacillus sp.]